MGDVAGYAEALLLTRKFSVNGNPSETCLEVE